MPQFVKLPPNLCDKNQLCGKTIYWRDYCSNHKKMQRRHKDPLTFRRSKSLTKDIKFESSAKLNENYASIDKIIADMENTTLENKIGENNEACKNKTSASKNVTFSTPPKSADVLLSKRVSLEPPTSYFGRHFRDVLKENYRDVNGEKSFSLVPIQRTSNDNEVYIPAQHNRSITYPVYQQLCSNCLSCRCKESAKSPDVLQLNRDSQKQSNARYTDPNEDYINYSTFFHDARRKSRGYFIIHPEFVSENNKATQSRQLDEKYIGQTVLGTHYINA